MRYELNTNSEIVEYNGNVQSISDKKAILESLFSQGTYECTSISNSGCEWTIEYKNTITNDFKKITIYYGNIRNEDRNNKEKKIQLSSKDPRSNSEKSIILGAYCYDSQDSLENIVFAGWNIDPNTNYPSNPSLRGLNIKNLQEARINGLHKNNFKENYVCTFRPEFIFYYINNIELLHNSSQNEITENKQNGLTVQKIYYGAPGTGKSHKVKEIVFGKDERTERVTFHPEYDYSSFVGSYKPTMDGDIIKYEFVPQAFTNIYVKAWNNLENDYYLVIEEINRGNCAEIFGDIFQLLDRTNDYKITPSKELKEHLITELEGNSNIDAEKLLLPPNLNILATMNTSDQSLFPMDSAFKRRWDWEYIPINYDDDEANTSSKFNVKISKTESFSWLKFIKAINLMIKENDNLGMDKCLGNYFIKPESNIIDLDTFINKAIFYLWNDVFKDEMEEDNIFKEKTSYEDFFPINTEGIKKVKEILAILDVDLNPA
ncbi:AAA family ATPase [Tenacibaculum finnmarkense]|uniref:AAA family ATPase n=1 Tax=Tenacibaculum finnmarkense TaxID=2781243 RepID=UPI001EFA8474|nr:AAA family ATPase [Tenacibaculum finnmarkense]MCG8237728.1 AAA family ATPase [Tenacibaculum finnmarkense genomovar ulcerans]